MKRYSVAGEGIGASVWMIEDKQGEYCHMAEVQAALERLREFIWEKDIPHPTIPEYIEWHKNIQEILDRIDKLIKSTESEREK